MHALDPTTAPDYLQPLLARLHGTTAEKIHRFAPPETGAREAAVLVLFAMTDSGPDILLTERAATLRSHSGQVAFPGGARDPEDVDAVDTALREANEEVGLDPAVVHVHASLPDLYIPVTAFAVSPILATAPSDYEAYVREPGEVARVERLRVADLADPEVRYTVVGNGGYRGPAFLIDGLFIWGFTGNILDSLLTMGGFEVPWDTERTTPLPKRFMR